MALEKVLGRCLASQEIRALLQKGDLQAPSFQEGHIQPSSFEPVIGDELFILDTERGLFRPQPDEQIYRTLLQLPARRRQKVNIHEGFELKRGFTYLLPLEMKVKFGGVDLVRSSPKSSIGRVFLHTRMIGDYNQGFEEMSGRPDTVSDFWLLVQPHAFNVVVSPGLSLNQVRFFQGLDAKLSPSEIRMEIEKSPIFYVKEEGGSIRPTNHHVTDGLRIHLDLSGLHTEGVVGLRARRNPVPIDLRMKEAYQAEDHFEPLMGKGKLVIERGEHYLIASKEVLKIPAHLSSELRRYSNLGFVGPLDFAGFIDNVFEGDLVFEVRSDEVSSMELTDGMPVSDLDFFRTQIPEKLYGAAIGSSYQGQKGVRPAKYFKSFDFSSAARNCKKLSRDVLVQDARVLKVHRKKEAGLDLMSDSEAQALFEDIKRGFFQSRYDCEEDPSILQPIPYVVVFGPDETLFSYVRASDISDYGDSRLFGKHSIGLGGHIGRKDAPDYILTCLKREAFREEAEIEGEYSEPKFLGTLVQPDNPVDRVHFGLVFAIHTKGRAKQKESSIVSGRMLPLDELLRDPERNSKYETWSRVLIPHLPELYKRSRS